MSSPSSSSSREDAEVSASDVCVRMSVPRYQTVCIELRRVSSIIVFVTVVSYLALDEERTNRGVLECRRPGAGGVDKATRISRRWQRSRNKHESAHYNSRVVAISSHPRESISSTGLDNLFLISSLARDTYTSISARPPSLPPSPRPLLSFRPLSSL